MMIYALSPVFVPQNTFHLARFLPCMISRLFLALSLTLVSVRAAEDPTLVALRAADDERVAAMIAADAARLNAVFSDELRYAHSTGDVDTKATFIDSIVSGRTKYEAIQYAQRSFSFPAPGVALVHGRAEVRVATPKARIEATLSFLSVWREEQGRWRFFAWQSCKVPPPVSGAEATPPGAAKLPVASAQNQNAVLKTDPQQSEHAVREMQGWTVHVSRRLLESEAQATARALELLGGHLETINKVVPAKPLAALHAVPLWLNPIHSQKDQPKAEYHPSAGWLRDNHRDPGMAKAVEFTNILIFEKECRRMPMFVLHELAHAYHDRVLGFENPEIAAAYAQAKEGGRYRNVDRWSGTAFSKADAYALTNAKEYFAETSEAFFGRNDFQPFESEELRRMDPGMHGLLGKLWGVTRP